MNRKKLLLPASLAVAALAAPRADACYPCGRWTTISDQQALCPGSDALWDELDTCVRTGPCAPYCAAYVASLDACTVGGVPTCTPTEAPAACNDCIYGGCPTEANACSDDVTGCVSSCSAWLAGGAICDVITAEEIAIEDCTCSGACASKCSTSCFAVGSARYFDNAAPMAPACAACLKNKNGCASERAACLAQ